MAAKQDKVNELQQGRVIPLDCLYVVLALASRSRLLAARCASLKNAFISMEAAITTRPFRKMLVSCSIKPGRDGPTGFTGPLIYLQKILIRGLIPWSATFTGHLNKAEAIFNARGVIWSDQTRIGNTPQHGVLFGMTGAGSR